MIKIKCPTCGGDAFLPIGVDWVRCKKCRWLLKHATGQDALPWSTAGKKRRQRR